MFYRIHTESSKAHPHKFLIIKKIQNTLRDSIFADCVTLIRQDHRISQEYNINTTMLEITHLPTNSGIIFRGMDEKNGEKLKGITNITGIIIDEITDLEEEDFSQIVSLFRQPSIHYRQISFQFNPVSDQSWLKKRFFDFTDPDVIIHHSTMHDNLSLDAEAKRLIIKENSRNLRLYEVQVLGMWGRTSLKGIAFPNFDVTKIGKELKYNPDKKLFLSFDFNLIPGCSLSIFQIEINEESKVLKCIDIIQETSTTATCEAFVKKYSGHTEGVTITGDVAGRQRESISEAADNHYYRIEKILAKFHPDIHLKSVNPSVISSIEYLNQVFSGEENIKIEIDLSATLLISDLTYSKVDGSGEKLVEYAKEKESGRKYEKTWHFSDTVRYALCQFFETEYYNYKNGVIDSSNNVYKVGSFQKSFKYRY